MNLMTSQDATASESAPVNLQFKTVLAPVDFSESSERAVCYAARIAEKYGARIVALHVVENSPGFYGFDAEVADALVSEAQHRLDKVCRAARIHPECAETMVRMPVDSLATEILLAAREIHADLIVLPASQRHGLFAGTADRVAHHAPCPVLFVPAPIPAAGKA